MKNNKTIGVTLRFFTNDLPKKVGKKDSHTPAWSCGVALMEANKEKEIKCDSEHFHFIEDIDRAVNVLFARAKIAVVGDIAYKERAKKRLTK